MYEKMCQSGLGGIEGAALAGKVTAERMLEWRQGGKEGQDLGEEWPE